MKSKTQFLKEMKARGLFQVTWLKKPTIKRLLTIKDKLEEPGMLLEDCLLIDDVVNLALDAYEGNSQ